MSKLIFALSILASAQLFAQDVNVKTCSADGSMTHSLSVAPQAATYDGSSFYVMQELVTPADQLQLDSGLIGEAVSASVSYSLKSKDAEIYVSVLVGASGTSYLAEPISYQLLGSSKSCK